MSQLGDFLRNLALVVDKNGGIPPTSLAELHIEPSIERKRRPNKRQIIKQDMKSIANIVFDKHGIKHRA